MSTNGSREKPLEDALKLVQEQPDFTGFQSAIAA